MISDIQYIKGIGPKRVSVLNKNGIESDWDLLEFFPRKYLDRSNIVPISEVSDNVEATVIGKIENFGIKRGRKPIFYLIISDGKALLEAVWFNYINQYKNIFKVGEWISLSGKISFYRGYQMVHPDYDKLGDGDLEGMLNTGKIISVYPGNEAFKKVGLTSYSFRKIFHSLFNNYLPEIPENLPETICNKYKFIKRKVSYYNIHFPESSKLLKNSILRFKYEEFFFVQLMLILQKERRLNAEPGLSFKMKSKLLQDLYERLPFQMTDAQKRVMKEIRSDMKRPHPMNRLLQGDVGSGKTLIALMAMLIAIDNGYQTALMVPTEVLADQHYFNVSKLLKSTNISVLLLTGNTSASQRKLIKSRLDSKEPLIIIGTHALIQENMQYSTLGLIIIDEQHRFGVMQRASLVDKGMQTDTLVMTATPIPRTLALTVYGNLEVSILDEMPPDRPHTQTIWRFEEKTADINRFVKEKVDKGEQVFIVYPLVEESEKMDIKAATESFDMYKNNEFKKYRTALLHGRLASDQKESIMRGFSDGNIDILFSTSVIEVGVDVPNATIMIIEHAERFGLSQLHQLRGRVGRGRYKSYCILKTPVKISETAQKRLQMLVKTNDGFQIAEEDLRLRGWGDFFGTHQHGVNYFKIANPVLDNDILQNARRDAIEIIKDDPQLRKEENQLLRNYFVANFSDKFNLIKIR